MNDPTNDEHRTAVEPLDPKTRDEWLSVSAQAAEANVGPWPCRVNNVLDAAAQSEPQSPVAPAYRLWIGDNLAREGQYLEAVRAFDSAIDSAQSAPRFLPQVDPLGCSLLHKAQAATLGGDAQIAISAYRELASGSSTAAALFQAGLVAEMNGDDNQASDLYGSATSQRPSSRTDDPAELARRALRRLEDPQALYMHSALNLADLLAKSFASRDTDQLNRLVSKTHFAIGPLGGHMAFEEAELLEHFYRDLHESAVAIRRKLIGSGGKLYLMTSGWKGDWFRGDIICLLTRTPKGWQWTGVAVSLAHDAWVERWRPAIKQTNQPLPFSLLAPWPAGESFRAGGLTQFGAQQAAVVAAGPIAGGILAAGFSANPCGFGPNGFYYNQGSTHDEEDAFAIDFTRYRPNVPYDAESEGTPVLSVLDGIVVSVSAGTESGDPSASNTVEIVHADPDNPTDTDRFRSRYLHLAGPFMIPVSVMMPVIVGQRLGLMDDTGNSILDHLHFSIHDRDIPHPNVSYGRSVRPTPLSGIRLGDGDSGTCVKSTNVERFPGLNFTPMVVSFGSVPAGEVRTQRLTVKNTSGRSVEISIAAPSSGSVFQWAAFSGRLANGEDRDFQVTFRPTSKTIVQGTLTVTSTAAGSPHSIGLLGKGPGGF